MNIGHYPAQPHCFACGGGHSDGEGHRSNCRQETAGDEDQSLGLRRPFRRRPLFGGMKATPLPCVFARCVASARRSRCCFPKLGLMDIGRRELDCQGQPPLIEDDVVFATELAPVGGIGACVIPAEGGRNAGRVDAGAFPFDLVVLSNLCKTESCKRF